MVDYLFDNFSPDSADFVNEPKISIEQNGIWQVYMSYSDIDSIIFQWADKHSLKLVKSWARGQTRCAYLSSVTGECFQIWIDPPRDGGVNVHAACVTGRTESDPPVDWQTDSMHLAVTLDEAMLSVRKLMAPAERYVV